MKEKIRVWFNDFLDRFEVYITQDDELKYEPFDPDWMEAPYVPKH